MSHRPGHQRQWGLGGRSRPQGLLGGSFISPIQGEMRSRLSGMNIESPSDVSRLTGETEEEEKLRLAREAAQRKKVTGAVGAGVGQLGGDMMKAYGRQEWKPMMNLGLGNQYGGRRRRF